MAQTLSEEDRKRIERVLGLWFAERDYDAPRIDARLDFWFGGSDELDETLKNGFARDIEQASHGKLMHWAAEARGRLALIVILDQFRRNVFRGTANAFVCDRLALKLCVEGIVGHHDRELEPIERVFFYMPMQHAESLRVQEKSVMVFEALAKAVSPTMRETFETFAQFAELHRDIVERFGRFPHRNAALGRENTPEEREFLEDEGTSFGQ